MANLNDAKAGTGKRTYFFELFISLSLSDSAVFACGRRSADTADPRGNNEGENDT